MGWRIVERRIGKAGGEKQRAGRQREWDRKYLRRHGLELQGREVVDVGTWHGSASHRSACVSVR